MKRKPLPRRYLHLTCMRTNTSSLIHRANLMFFMRFTTIDSIGSISYAYLFLFSSFFYELLHKPPWCLSGLKLQVYSLYMHYHE